MAFGLTFEQVKDLHRAIDAAREALEALDKARDALGGALLHIDGEEIPVLARCSVCKEGVTEWTALDDNRVIPIGTLCATCKSR